jgi:hypothetical protein
MDTIGFLLFYINSLSCALSLRGRERRTALLIRCLQPREPRHEGRLVNSETSPLFPTFYVRSISSITHHLSSNVILAQSRSRSKWLRKFSPLEQASRHGSGGLPKNREHTTALFLQRLEGPNKLGTYHHPAVREASLLRNISLETYRS